MQYSQELLESVRKILNETRQDRTCRAFLAKKQNAPLIPFLGSLTPHYFFLGLCPVGYDIAEAPTNAQEYLDWASGYFGVEQHDRGSFAAYLPYAANHSGDYVAFGEAATVAHMVPIMASRTSEITLPLVRACWPKTMTLVRSLKPKLILCHGSLVWKFLTGQEEGSQPIFLDLPESHRHTIADLYEKLDADRLPFQTRLAEFPDDYKPWIVPLAHLGGAGGGKESRKKGEAAVTRARRALSSPAPAGEGGTRIRVVRKVT